MVLNALAIDPRRTWKGSWRWFHEQMLDCCRPLEDVKREGITLPQAACLARCNGARAELHRYGSFTLEELRRHVSGGGGGVEGMQFRLCGSALGPHLSAQA
jgi:glutathione gamma-glutamylcysteinyltransferase